MKPDRQRPVTVEDLLRLKRAERPSAEYWAQFDRELRAKQLAALVEKRPWWHLRPDLSLDRLLRFSLPIGAAAALGLALIPIHETPAPAGAATTASDEATPPTATLSPAITTAETPALASLTAEPTLPAASATPAPLEPATVAVVATATSPTPSASLTPAASLVRLDAMPLASLPITANFAPGKSHLLSASASGFESRALPAPRTAVDPLHQMTPPGEARRTRLLAAMTSAAMWETNTRATERAASRLTEERLYDQVQRFGARGDRVLVKF